MGDIKVTLEINGVKNPSNAEIAQVLYDLSAKNKRLSEALMECMPIVFNHINELDVNNLTTQSLDRQWRDTLKKAEQALKDET